ncbi:hypothetical protein AB4156_28970 [Cupriavidus sp. 2MCAB6]|uniref:hypothetical protein n=1 Tax=Cupriavidus sp. 2MCAB6 TaxID=3232981 RepID=UPI003F8F7B64
MLPEVKRCKSLLLAFRRFPFGPEGAKNPLTIYLPVDNIQDMEATAPPQQES